MVSVFVFDLITQIVIFVPQQPFMCCFVPLTGLGQGSNERAHTLCSTVKSYLPKHIEEVMSAVVQFASKTSAL